MKLSFKKIFSKFSKKQFFSEFSLKRASRDWYGALFVTLVIVIVTAFLGAYLFWKMRAGDLFIREIETNTPVQTLDRELLKETLLIFDERQKDYDKFLEEDLDFPDPIR